MMMRIKARMRDDASKFIMFCACSFVSAWIWGFQEGKKTYLNFFMYFQFLVNFFEIFVGFLMNWKLLEPTEFSSMHLLILLLSISSIISKTYHLKSRLIKLEPPIPKNVHNIFYIFSFVEHKHSTSTDRLNEDHKENNNEKCYYFWSEKKIFLRGLVTSLNLFFAAKFFYCIEIFLKHEILLS